MADDRNDLWFFIVSTVLALLLGAASAYLSREILASVCLCFAAIFLVIIPFIRGKHHWWWVAPTVLACGGAILLVSENNNQTAVSTRVVRAAVVPTTHLPAEPVRRQRQGGIGNLAKQGVVEHTAVPPVKEITYYSREQLSLARHNDILAGDDAWFETDAQTDTEGPPKISAPPSSDNTASNFNAAAPTTPQPLGDFPKGVMDAGVRKGVDGFLIVWNENDLEQEHAVVVRRDRSEANLEPARFVMSFTAPDCRYVKISRFFEEALVCYSQIGSGGFLTLHVALWNGHEYIDIARDVPRDRSCGAFSFADFDGDGTKELIITHCRAAYESATEIYSFDEKRFAYVPVDADDRLYKKGLVVAEEIKDDKPFWGGEGDDTPWKDPQLRDPETARALRNLYYGPVPNRRKQNR